MKSGEGMFKRARRVCREGRKELREESDSEDGSGEEWDGGDEGVRTWTGRW